MTGSPIPLVDVVAHAKALHGRPGDGRSDIITTITIYSAAALATAGFVLASVVDEVLRVKRGARG